jgi:hypothetical protein
VKYSFSTWRLYNKKIRLLIEVAEFIAKFDIFTEQVKRNIESSITDLEKR